MPESMKAAGRRLSSQRGQAMTETVLMTLPLILLLAAVYQLFLADEYSFRLATRSHARLFTEQAFPANSTAAGYLRRYVYWVGPEMYVPVVGFFRWYGLSPDQMRIRSVEGGPKVTAIGAGTAPSLAGADRPSVYGHLAAADEALAELENAQFMSTVP
jgi:hypothetical protein